MRANILLTCCGHKAYLPEVFKTSGRCGRVVAADNDPTASIQHAADEFVVVPSIAQKDCYVNALLEICSAHSVHAVIPQNDLDLVLLAGARDLFEARGVRVFGVDRERAEAVADKVAAARLFESLELPTVETWVHGQREVSLPVVAKSRHGQGSEGLRYCRTEADLAAVAEGSVIQPWLVGDEFNLDIARDATGDFVAVVIKRKLAMHQGSTSGAILVHDSELDALGRRIAAALSPLGGIDVDVIVDAERGPIVIDVNPRLGGGFPFAASVAPEYVDALLTIARGEAPESFRGYPSGVEVRRHASFVTVSGSRPSE